MHSFEKPFPKLRKRNWAIRLLAAAGLVASVTGGNDVRATPSTFTFPAPNPGWVIARNGGMPLSDIEGDAAGARDMVGNAMNPALYIASDATHLYFRLRLDVDPRQNATNIGPFGWGCLINTDSDLTTYEYSTIVDGVNNPDTIYFYKNTVTATPNSPTDAPDLPAITTVGSPLTAAVGHAEVVRVTPGAFGNNGNIDDDFFMDWAIELTPALMAGFNPANPANYYCGSANNGTNIGTDCTGTPPGGSGCGPLNTVFTDPISCGPLGCAVCGDGQTGAAEGCDDGNRTNGDGCNSVCLLELGRPCAGMSPSCASGYCDPTGNICACDGDADCAMGQVCATGPNPNVCVMPGCGNNVIDMGEGCDDGNTTAGDGCNAMCLKELGQTCAADMVCASGFCDPDASTCACDQNSDCPMPNVCNVLATPNACVAPGCGNSVVETNEGCDDGNTMNGDGCNSACKIELLQGCMTSPSCASGFCDPMVNQCICDGDNDCAAGQTCNLTLMPHQCVTVGCGNGMINAGEGCDDGNTTPGDGCNSQCLKELGQTCTAGNVCASGFCDMMICSCDTDVDCPGFQLCNLQPDPNVCVMPGCGNQVVEVNEGCDDGNTMNGDGCNSACLRELGEACSTSDQCASTSCDPMDNSCVCDENADCPVGTPVCKLSANPNICVIAGCGNGVLEAMEGCDDNNMASGDGCNAMCLLEIGQVCPGGSMTCASGYCDPVGTECACDDDADCPTMQLCNLLASPHKCVDKGCGNGVVEMGEGCDDGNMTGNDGCNAACLLEIGLSCPGGSSTCASGFCDPTDNTCACDTDADCTTGQVCNTTTSPNVCVAAGCGNSVVEANEGCDDGNTADSDGCSANCLLELGQTCNATSTDCQSGFCDPDGDVCACDQDIDCPEGTTCNTTPNPNICVSLTCGDGKVDANEGCDDGNTADGDGCNSACLIELGKACTTSTSCASGLCDMSICVCDQDVDCATGELCNTTADPNTCVMAGCGNGVLEANEGCDDGNTMPGDGCDALCTKELGQTCTDGTECGSTNCDETTNQCVCNKDGDCAMGETCDTTAMPHACVMVPGCRSDADCSGGLHCNVPTGACVECTQDSHCGEGLVCDESQFKCVQCTQDTECGTGTCTAETQTCAPEPVVVEGGGILCTASSTPVDSNNVPFGLLGLLGLGVLRRRRR